MSDDPVVQSPARLIDEPTEVASILTRSEAQFRSDLDEGQAWKRLEPSLDAPAAKRRRPGIMITSVVTSAVAMAVGWYAGAHYAGHSRRGTAASAAASESALAFGGIAGTETIAQPLKSGESLFADGTRAIVGEGALGQFTNGPEGINVRLLRGDVELSVARQANGQRFSVQCPKYELRVMGTRFNVSVASDCVRLRVVEGKVAVIARNVQVAEIGAAQQWASEACDDPGMLH